MVVVLFNMYNVRDVYELFKVEIVIVEIIHMQITEVIHGLLICDFLCRGHSQVTDM